MELVQIPDLLLCSYRAKRAVFLWGPAGCGKSEVVAQSATKIATYLVKEGQIKNEDEFGFIDLRLGTQELGDLIGLPRVKEIEPGEFRTVWSEPEWWPKEGTHGLIFLDEFNRAGTNDILQAMFQFVLGTVGRDKKITRYLHTHRLPDGWNIVCAGNPDTSDYVVQALDDSMLDRLIQIRVDVDRKIAAEWMRNNLKDADIWKFVNENNDALGKAPKFTIEVKPSSRSYTFIDSMFSVMTKEEWKKMGREVTCGIVGETLGNLFYQYKCDNVLRPISAKDVMKCTDFEKFANERVIKYVTKQKSHLNLIDTTLNEIVGTIKDGTKYLDNEYANLLMFLNIIPKDMNLTFIANVFNLGEPAKHIIGFLATKEDAYIDLKHTYFRNSIIAIGFTNESIDEGLTEMANCIAEYEAAQVKEKEALAANKKASNVEKTGEK
jgi:hypothetical protein